MPCWLRPHLTVAGNTPSRNGYQYHELREKTDVDLDEPVPELDVVLIYYPGHQ